jgi:hypothetical protein
VPENSFEDTKNELGLMIGILILALTLYFAGRALVTKIPSEEEILVKPKRKIEINLEIFENKLLKTLSPIEDFTFPTEIGRENPFIPY